MDKPETKSDAIRRLARRGMVRADIARALGVRYQHVYNVLTREDSTNGRTKATAGSKPPLTSSQLKNAGFERVSCWQSRSGLAIELERSVFKDPGVYAFVIDGRVVYVGLASMGLSKRLYFYANPGSTQRTSLRLNRVIGEHCVAGKIVEIYAAKPDDFDWHGLPVNGCAGLELGLIKQFDLPWNVRSAR